MAERDGEEADADVHLPDVNIRLIPELFVTVRELLDEIAECVVSDSSNAWARTGEALKAIRKAYDVTHRRTRIEHAIEHNREWFPKASTNTMTLECTACGTWWDYEPVDG